MTRALSMFLLALALAPAQIAAPPVVGTRGAVASPEPHAADAGIEMLKAGGSAIDAAVAMGFALAVTLPTAGNLGGGGFLVAVLEDGRHLAIDFREMAPRRAHRNMYLDEAGEPIPERSLIGGLASGVPGTVAGLCHIQARYGRLSLARVLEPAIRLARDGWVVDRWLVRSTEAARELLERHPETRRIFLAGGPGLAADTLWRQPELAATLERIARQGAQGFYEGETAALIAAEMERTGGLIDEHDLKAYRVVEREALVGSYRGRQIVTMPPPSSGGVALLQMLGMLESAPIGEYGFGTERTIHLQVEAMREAFHDRAHWMGDPDFVSVPVQRLTSPDYIARMRERLTDRARPSRGLVRLPIEKEETTHYSVMDAKGNAVAVTTTLNTGYGSGVTVTGAGFLMNNEMDDFAVAPGRPNVFDLIQGEANAIAPKKRPLSSMTPTIVLEDGRPVLAIGSPGGPTIINTVFQCLVNVLDHRMNVAEAIAAPRFHHQWLPDEIRHERFAINQDVARGLLARGHVLRERPPQGDAHGVHRDLKTGQLSAASDPRHGGAAKAF